MRQQNIGLVCTYLLLGLSMAGCTFAPDVPASKAGPIDDVWPSLLTREALSSLTDGLEERPPEMDEETETLAARSAALRAKAASLNAPVLTAAERDRLIEATATP